MRAFVLCAVLAGLLLAGCHAAEADQLVRQKLAQLEREVHQAFAKKDYAAAADKCALMLELSPGRNEVLYNLACAQARLGKTDDAFASLSKAVDNGYSNPAHMKQDADLAPLREDKRFEELAAKAREAAKKAPYEKGSEIPGVKTVEDYPEGGLRYRLRMNPEATDEKPQRLVVWLHPSGGSGNQMAESLSKFFIQRGYALLVLTKKQWAGWAEEEMKLLMDKTLPEVEKVPGIDARRPLLMGFSAGGQAALSYWEAAPEKAGGLIVDAAYPLDMAAYARGQVQAMKLPQNEAIKQTPIFSLVGDQDGGHQLWKKCEDDWRKAGVPLTVEYVPGGKHQWLFGKGQLERLGRWLDEVSAGKLPAGAPPAKAEDQPAAEAKSATAAKTEDKSEPREQQ